MSSSVTVRGNKYGICIKLSSTASYEKIKEDIALQFKDTDNFFGDEKLAISFEGQSLTIEQQEELVGIIQQNCDLHIVCIMEENPEQESRFQKGINDTLMEFDSSTGQFYKGNLRSGQVLDFEKSVIIIGDVNAGASVVSKGNIVILGTLRGSAFAGCCGKRTSFIVALDMKPLQIRIADVITTASDASFNKNLKQKQPKIAFLEDEQIYIEPLNKSVLNDIKL